jgi:hypothetical protein
LIATTLPLLISGCASFSLFGGKEVKPLEVKTVAVERTRLNLKEPSPLKGRELNWVIVTPENAEEVFKKLKDNNTDVVLFAITDDGYEQLALTMAEIRNYIAQQRAVLIKYKEYYEPAETPASK